jgi:hypothetical protein
MMADIAAGTQTPQQAAKAWLDAGYSGASIADALRGQVGTEAWTALPAETRQQMAEAARGVSGRGTQDVLSALLGDRVNTNLVNVTKTWVPDLNRTMQQLFLKDSATPTLNPPRYSAAPSPPSTKGAANLGVFSQMRAKPAKKKGKR